MTMATGVPTSRNPLMRLFMGWLGGLRHPQLFLLFAALFGIDFLLPDAIPFLDEIMLLVGTLLLGSMRRRRDEPIDVTPPRR
jgi:hypothetical protein